MEFWGVEVKSGQPFEVNLGEGKVLHLSQACLGELKKDKFNESVCLHITIEEKKLVLGTLHSERLPQQLFDLVFDKDFQLSHNWKNGSVYFYGYKADQPTDDHDDSEDFDTDDEDEDDLPLPIVNGKQEAKKEEKPVGVNKTSAAKGSAAGKQKVKIVEPEKDIKPDGSDSDSEDSDDSDDAMSEDSDSEEDNENSSDDDDEDSDEEEETPKKQQSGKKRMNESAIKTPGTDKKAKLASPQKTGDGKKGGGHVATPHPSKQAAKTPANKSNQKSPASEGAHSCKSCNRNFKTENALQSHNQAKHK